MTNRASTVCPSRSLALNRNALSGGKGFCPWAGNARPSANAAKAMYHRSGDGRRGLRSNPVKVGRRSIGDGDSDDLGKFVGMALSNGLLDSAVELAASLDRNRSLLCRFDFASPVIE